MIMITDVFFVSLLVDFFMRENWYLREKNEKQNRYEEKKQILFRPNHDYPG